MVTWHVTRDLVTRHIAARDLFACNCTSLWFATGDGPACIRDRYADPVRAHCPVAIPTCSGKGTSNPHPFGVVREARRETCVMQVHLPMVWAGGRRKAHAVLTLSVARSSLQCDGDRTTCDA